MDETRYGYTVVIPPLRQRDAEQYITTFDELDGKNRAIVSNGNVVRAAARMGWIVKTAKGEPDDGVPIGNLTEENVGELWPYVIDALSTDVSAAYTAAFEVPGE